MRWSVWREAPVVLVACAVDLYVYGGDATLRGGGTAPAWLVPTATLLAYATLLARWCRPLAVFGVQWALGLLALGLPAFAPFCGLLIALHAVASLSGARVAAAALAATLVPLGINNAEAVGTSVDARVDVVVLTLVWAAIALAVWAVGRRTHAADRRTALTARAAQEQAGEAVRAERLRLARDLHDIVAHAVSAMILQASGGRTLVAPDDPVHEVLTTVESVGVQAMHELHRLLGLLRAVDAEHASEEGAEGAHPIPGPREVAGLVRVARASGIDVAHVVDGSPVELDSSVGLAAYRVVQEVLTNAAKHGGAGTRVRLRERWVDGRLEITARSTPGLGGLAGLPSSGFGLRGLRERVVLVGGRLDAGESAGDVVLHAELPTVGLPTVRA